MRTAATTASSTVARTPHSAPRSSSVIASSVATICPLCTRFGLRPRDGRSAAGCCVEVGGCTTPTVIAPPLRRAAGRVEVGRRRLPPAAYPSRGVLATWGGTMPSRQDQLHSYQFSVQRVVSALVMRETDPAQAPFRRAAGATLASILLAVVIA